MRDYWYAECIPCGWSTHHDNQDAAIKAAEDHVFSTHRDVPPAVRGEKFIGHVINRTENAYAVQQPSAPAQDAQAGSTVFSWQPAAPAPAQLTAQSPSATGTPGDGSQT